MLKTHEIKQEIALALRGLGASRKSNEKPTNKTKSQLHVKINQGGDVRDGERET